MDINQIERNLETLVSGYSEDSFIYGLLSAYGIPNAAIARLKKGDQNLSKIEGEILWKKKVFFKKETELDLHSAIDQLRKSPAIIKQHPRRLSHKRRAQIMRMRRLRLNANKEDTDILAEDVSRQKKKPAIPVLSATTGKVRGNLGITAANQTPSKSLDIVQSKVNDGKRNSYFEEDTQDSKLDAESLQYEEGDNFTGNTAGFKRIGGGSMTKEKLF